MEEEEQERILKGSVESAVGHMVGIMYSSMSDSSWKEGKPIDVGFDIETQWWYQILPYGATYKDAERINIRFDRNNFPCTSEEYFQHQWNISKDVNTYREFISRRGEDQWMDFGLKEVFPVVDLGEDAMITCCAVHMPRENPIKQAVYVHSTKTVGIYSTAYPGTIEKLDDEATTAKPCHVIVHTCSDVKVTEEDQHLERITGLDL